MAYLLFIDRPLANKDVDCSVNQSDPWYRENGVAEHGFVTETKAVVEEFTLAKAAARFWPFQVHQLGTNSNEPLNGFLLQFLQADVPGFLLWQLLICRTPLFLIERRDEIEARKLQLRRKIPFSRSMSFNRTLEENVVRLAEDDASTLYFDRKSPRFYTFWLGLTTASRLLPQFAPLPLEILDENEKAELLDKLFSVPDILLVKVVGMDDEDLLKILLDYRADASSHCTAGRHAAREV